MKTNLLIVAFIVGAFDSFSAETLPAADPETVRILKDFEKSFAVAIKDVTPDIQFKVISAELVKLGMKLTDAQLPAVESYALTVNGAGMRWWYGFFYVEKGKLDSAAHLFVADLAIKKGNRSYVMWKYWEHYLGQRENYQELSREIGNSFMRQFETGNADFKLVVAELFGKGDAEAKMSVVDFKKAIDFDKKIGK